MPLSDRDIQRIVKEISSVRDLDVVKFVEEKSPWFRILDSAILRLSRTLSRLGVQNVLHGLRPLPFYGVPYPGRDRMLAIKLDSGMLEEILEKISSHGFRRMAYQKDGVELLDLQENKRVELRLRPGSLEWSREIIERCFEREGVRLLSAEDYLVSLLSEDRGIMMVELAAKIIYANRDRIDYDYLVKRASDTGVGDLVKDLVERLESKASR